MDAYRTRRVGGSWGHAGSLASAGDSLATKLATIHGPYNLRVPPGDWGPDRTRPEAVTRAAAQVSRLDYGGRVRVRGSRPDREPKFVIQRVFLSEGPQVLQAALSQLGVRYVFGDSDPAGGGSSGFDCSGFTMWSYEQVDVSLPHNAEAQRVDPQVQTFTAQAKAKPGDLVFMWFPNGRGIPRGHASHVGLFLAAGKMIDTRNPVDEPVGVRGIETDSVVGYGFVYDVTGPH